jgi:hypothetical protein
VYTITWLSFFFLLFKKNQFRNAFVLVNNVNLNVRLLMTNRIGRSAVSVELGGQVVDSIQNGVGQSIQLFGIHSHMIDKAPARCSHHRSANCVGQNDGRDDATKRLAMKQGTRKTEVRN